MALNVTSEQKDNRTYVVRPVGSIDAGTHSILGNVVDSIMEKLPKSIIFDMKDVTFMSSAGLSVFLSTEKWLQQTGGNVLLLHLQPQIRKVFDIVQALPSQQIFASTQELDAYLTEMQRQVKEKEMK